MSSMLNALYRKKSKTNLVVKNKSSNKNIYNPVTNYDKLLEKFIRNFIQKSFPEDGIIGNLKTKKRLINSNG